MEMLNDVFNPASMGFLVNETYSEASRMKVFVERREYEDKLFNEITTNLIKDLEDSGIKANTSSKILIKEIALDLILISRVKFYLMGSKEVVQYIYKHKKSSEVTNNLKGTKSIEYEPIDCQEIIHPLYDDFIFKVEKNINKKLQLLGLLPTQQLERQKMQIVEKLKKSLIDIETKGGLSYKKSLVINSQKDIKLTPPPNMNLSSASQ